jgi:hypothetical protein
MSLCDSDAPPPTSKDGGGGMGRRLSRSRHVAGTRAGKVPHVIVPAWTKPCKLFSSASCACTKFKRITERDGFVLFSAIAHMQALITRMHAKSRYAPN